VGFRHIPLAAPRSAYTTTRVGGRDLRQVLALLSRDSERATRQLLGIKQPPFCELARQSLTRSDTSQLPIAAVRKVYSITSSVRPSRVIGMVGSNTERGVHGSQTPVRAQACFTAGNILTERAHPVVDLDVACARAAQGSAVKFLIVSPSSQGTALLSILALRSCRRLEQVSWPALAPPEPHKRGRFRNRYVKTHSTVRVLNHDKSGTNLPIRDSRS